MEEKKKRAPNFSQFEVGILLELVGNSASILENKSTDGSSLREKQATWLDLTSQFNAVPGVTKRSTQNLKVCYENLKRRLRKDLADEKVETYKTGGGKKNIKTTNIDPKLLEIMGHSVRPLQNAFVSDTSYQGDVLYDGSLSVVTTQYEVPSTSTAPEMEPVEQASTVSATVIQDITQRVNVQTPVDMVSPNIFQEKEVAHSKTPASSKQYQWNRRRMPQKPKPSCDAVADTFKKRISVLENQLRTMEEEHLKEIRIKNLKISVLRQKLKYWKKKILLIEMPTTVSSSFQLGHSVSFQPIFFQNVTHHLRSSSY